jgi:hypothetical protein
LNNYKKHALREFEYAGWLKDGKYKDEMQELICKQVIDLLELFSKLGHSGSSAPYAINLFTKLAKFEPIGGIKGTDDEYGTDCGDHQNKRLSSVFRDEKGQYYLNAIVWQGEKSYDAFTGTVNGIRSRQYIKSFPFIPKTFYVKVGSIKIKNKFLSKILDKIGFNVVTCGDGDYIYYIKDRKKLKEVFKYYKK